MWYVLANTSHTSILRIRLTEQLSGIPQDRNALPTDRQHPSSKDKALVASATRLPLQPANGDAPGRPVSKKEFETVS